LFCHLQFIVTDKNLNIVYNVWILGERVTHRYHSDAALHSSRRKSLGQCRFNRRGGFWGSVRELRAWTKGLVWRWKEGWKDL